MCLLNFYTTRILTSTFCTIECISRLMKVTDSNSNVPNCNANWKPQHTVCIQHWSVSWTKLTVQHAARFNSRWRRLFQITIFMHNSFILQQYVCYITILNIFRAAPCSSSGGQILSPQPLVSSPSVNSRTVCRWRADWQVDGNID